MKSNICCFIGHRKINQTDDLKKRLYNEIEKLILHENVHTFLFGGKGQFDDLCYTVVTALKEKYCCIKRIYVRAEFPYIDESYKSYLLKRYEDTYFPPKIINAGKASFVERNYEMIDNSSCCIFYYDADYVPQRRKISKRSMSDYQPKSGTALAYEYAVKKKLFIINVKT